MLFEFCLIIIRDRKGGKRVEGYNAVFLGIRFVFCLNQFQRHYLLVVLAICFRSNEYMDEIGGCSGCSY